MPTTSIENAILEAVDRRRNELFDLVARLVRVSTVNPYSGDESAGSEKPGQDLLVAEMCAAGAEVSLVPVPPDIYQRCGILGPAGRDWTGRANVIGRFSLGDGGRKVIVNCHMDTVGTDGYQGDPFEGAVRDGRIWGRGASDSKGNLVSGFVAAWAIASVAAGAGVRGELIVQSVVDEECNGAGAGTLACIEAGIVGDAAICLDGSDQRPYTGCDGVVTPEVTVIGRSGHSAAGAVNGIDKLLAIKSAIDEFRAARLAMTPPRQVNIGIIRGGTLPAIVPHKAWMQYNVNYAPDDVDATAGPYPGSRIMRQFEELVAAAAGKDEYLRDHPPTVTWIKDSPCYRVPGDLPIVRIAHQAYVDVLGNKPADLLLGWSDAAHFWNVAHMPVIGMGGGVGASAHASVEYVDMAGLLANTKAVALAAYRLLAM